MTPDRWDRVKSIFEEAVELPPRDRDRLLDAACDADPELRHQVIRMLEAHDATTAVIDRPAVSPGLFGGFLNDSVAFRTGDLAGGRYRILSLLGQGGMGQVFKACDEQSGQLVALKALRPHFAQDPKLLARFRQEMRLLERVRHPNVCRVHHFAPDADPVHFTMELLEGETLAERLKREGWLSPAAALGILRQVAHALDAAHAEGIIHRDFKPGNIMLTGDRAVVTDFGVARAERKFDAETAFTTTGGYAMGTPAYMAPEQVEGKPATAAADIYALGTVFYEMLTGEQPYAGQTPMAVIARKLREPAAPLRSRLPNIGRRWEAAIQRCLALDPDDRFERATDLLPLLEGSLRARATTWFHNHKPLARRIAFVASALGLAGAGWVGYDQATRYRPLPAAQALYEKGLAAEDAGAIHGAAQSFRDAIAADGRHALAHVHLAWALGELDQLDLARDEALRVDSLLQELRSSRADRQEIDAVRQTILREYGAAAERFSALAQGTDGGPRRARFLLNQATALERHNRTRDALKILETLPATARTLTARATLVARLRQPANDLWDRAEQLTPDADSRAAVVIDRVASEAGRVPVPQRRARLEAIRALALSPVTAARADLMLARIETSERQVDAAKRRADAAVATALAAGADALAANGKIDLAQAFVAQHEYAAAESIAREALSMTQRNRNRRAEARAKLVLANSL